MLFVFLRVGCCVISKYFILVGGHTQKDHTPLLAFCSFEDLGFWGFNLGQSCKIKCPTHFTMISLPSGVLKVYS